MRSVGCDHFKISRHIRNQQLSVSDREGLCKAVNDHGVGVVAIGNGTACRETEALVAELIQGGLFSGDNISYAIVSEQVRRKG